MKFSKYCITAILFSIIFFTSIICNGVYILKESIHEYTVHVADVRGVNVFELEEYANKHELILYARTEEQTTLQDYRITYYTASEHIDDVQAYTGLMEGHVNNMIEMHLNIEYATFSDMQNANSIDRWTLIGSEEDKAAFVQELNAQDHYTVEYSEGRIDVTAVIPYGLMACAVLILLLYSYMDATFQKKETAIAALHGASVWLIYIRNILMDCAVTIGIYALLHVVRARYTMMSAVFSEMYLLLIPLLLGLFLIYLTLVRFKAREIIYGHQHSKRLMSLLFVLKNLSAVVFCIVILISTSFVPSIQKYKKAEAFFQSNPQYTFFAFRYDYDIQEVYQSESIEAIQNQVRSQKIEKMQFCEMTDEIFQPICLADLANNTVDDPADFDAIYSNYRAIPYIQQVIPAVGEIEISDYDCIFLIPEGLTDAEVTERTDYLTNQFATYEGYLPDEKRILVHRYDPSAQILCFDYYNDFQLVYYDAPAICIASDTYRKCNYRELTINHDLLFHGMIYKVENDQQMREVFDSYTFSPIASNAYEKFQLDYQLQQTLFYLSILLIGLMLLFYASTIYSILQLDYQVNAIELALKRTLGYSIIEKHRHHFRASLIMAAVNLAIAIGCAVLTSRFSFIAAVSVPLFLVVMDCVLLYGFIFHIEKQKIVKILKGGAL